MITSITLKQDGEIADERELTELGFLSLLSDPRDFRTDKTGVRRFDFVGFAANMSGDLLAVVPKHFHVRDEKRDLANLFALVARMSLGPPGRINDFGVEFTSDYPIASFMEIHDHYRRWGLDVRFDRRHRTTPPGRLDWRRTFEGNSWVPSRNGLVPFPVIYDTRRRLETFLSECTIFAIDHTLERFGFLLEQEPTGRMKPPFDLDADREGIVARLCSLRTQTFRDSTLTLIDALLTFFGTARRGDQFVIKKYNFHTIWEDAVRTYLNRRFAGVDANGAPVFATPSVGATFEKTRFSLNREAPDQKLEPDFYAVSPDGRTQFVFDAKYYTSLTEFDYKQLSYTILLDGLLDDSGERRFDRTHSALLLPSDRARSEGHFAPDPVQSDLARLFPTLRITAAYLDAREVLADYREA